MGRRDLGGGVPNCSWHPLLQSDEPMQTVTSPPPKLASSHCIRGWHSLVYGQPCHTWDRCTSPTPCKTTSVGGDEMRMPQEKDGKAVTQWPTSKASLGWKNGKLQLRLWTSTGASTEDGWRPQVKWFGCRPQKEHVCKAEGWHLYPLMLVDSEPKEECCHSLNWVKAGKAKQKYGGEWNG